MLGAASSAQKSPGIPDEIISGNQPVETISTQAEAETLISATVQPFAVQGSPSPDGLALLESYCARCHTAQSLEQIEKTRPEWEKAMSFMEEMGVQLSEADKVILLDYLAAGQP